jgi:hypothetical protein
MILLVLFIVFFALWLVSSIPNAPAPFGQYSNWLAVICVGLLGFAVFHGRL